MRPPLLNSFSPAGLTRRPPTRPTRCVYGYVRSRHQRPRSSKDLIEPQRNGLDAWAAGAGLAFTHVFIELGSEARQPLFKRTQGRAALAVLRPGDMLVAARFDRLFGLAEDAHASLALARQQKFEVHALDVDAGRWRLEGNRAMDAVLMAFASDTRYGRSLQRKGVKATATREGQFLGGHVPFGFSLGSDGTLKLVPAQQEFTTQLHAMKAKKLTLEQMRQAGTALGYELTRMGISKILRRKN